MVRSIRAGIFQRRLRKGLQRSHDKGGGQGEETCDRCDTKPMTGSCQEHPDQDMVQCDDLVLYCHGHKKDVGHV